MRAVYRLSLSLFLAATCWGAPVKVCEKSNLKVVSPSSAWLTCDSGIQGIEGEGKLYDVTNRDDNPAADAVLVKEAIPVKIEPVPGATLKYSLVRFDPALQAGEKYVLIVKVTSVTAPEKLPAPPSGPDWAPLYLSFTTKSSALLTNTMEPLDIGASFRLSSNLAIAGCAGQMPSIQEVVPQGAAKRHPAILRRLTLNDPKETDTANPPGCELPPLDSNQQPQFDPQRIGVADLSLRDDRFRQGKAVLDVQGVKDVFGQTIGVPKDKQKLTLKEVPKGKDDSTYYLKFGHQAGPGSTPSWSLDAKLAPVLPGDFFGYSPTLNALGDVGNGAAITTSNTIKLGAGLTRLYLTGGPILQGIRFSPVLNFETGRDFDQKRNLVVEPDFRFYFKDFNHSRALRIRRAFVARHEELARTSPEDAAKLDPQDREFRKLTGFFAQFWTGAELGGAFLESTVTTKDKSSSVIVPTYGIIRPRPHMQATFELWRFSFDMNYAPRYVASTETVGRIVKLPDAAGVLKDNAILDRIHGWRQYGEVSLQIALDQSGHVSLSTTYKRGSAPPMFDKVNTVVSGISIKY